MNNDTNAVMPHGTPKIRPRNTRARNATALSTPKCTMSGRGGRAGRAPGGAEPGSVTRWSAYRAGSGNSVASAQHHEARLGHLVHRVVRPFARVAAVADAAGRPVA